MLLSKLSQIVVRFYLLDQRQSLSWQFPTIFSRVSPPPHTCGCHCRLNVTISPSDTNFKTAVTNRTYHSEDLNSTTYLAGSVVSAWAELDENLEGCAIASLQHKRQQRFAALRLPQSLHKQDRRSRLECDCLFIFIIPVICPELSFQKRTLLHCLARSCDVCDFAPGA